MPPLQSYLSFRNFSYPRLWSFNDGTRAFIRKAHFIDTEQKKLIIKIDPKESSKFTRKFASIVAKYDGSTVALLSCTGRILPTFLGTETNVEITPLYIIHQMNGNASKITKIDRINGSVPGLNFFLGSDVINFDRKKREFTEKEDDFRLIEISERLRIGLQSNFDIERNEKLEFIARPENIVELYYDKEVETIEAIYFFHIVEDFFNFLFPDITSTNQFNYQTFSKGRPVYKKILLNSYKETSNITVREEYYILFTADDVATTGLEAILKNWVQNYHSFESIWNVLKYIKTQTISEKDRFISFVRTLEGIHRVAFSNVTEETINQHQLRIQKITDSLEDNDDKELVRIGLAYAYEPALSKRLKKINEFASSRGVQSLEGSLRNKITHTRNQIVHGLPDSANKPTLSDSEMIEVNNILAMQLKVILMSLIGVSAPEIRAIALKSNQFKNYYRD